VITDKATPAQYIEWVGEPPELTAAIGDAKSELRVLAQTCRDVGAKLDKAAEDFDGELRAYDLGLQLGENADWPFTDIYIRATMAMLAVNKAADIYEGLAE